jgi:hypothetical protein
MTIAPTTRSLRFGLTAVLCAAWLYAMLRWSGHPNGAGVALMGLLSFTGLGLAAWVVPIEHRGLRITARVVGAVVGLGTLALYVLLVIALRNGL